MGTGFSKKKKQAKMMQKQFEEMQNQMKDLEVEGSAGNGLVKIIITGEHEVKSIKINPECVDADDIDGLEVLIKAAFNDANKKLAEQSGGGMPDMPGGMPDLSGFGF